MGFTVSYRHLRAGVASAVVLMCITPAAFALSNGCTAVNNLSGSTSLSYSANRYPASDFAPGDALTLSFTDSGAGKGASPMNTDSVSLARGIRPVWLPGHTPGHTGFRIHSDKKELLIWGDIVHFPHIQSAHPTVSIMFDVDPVQAEETRKKALQQAVDEKLIIAGMHLDQSGFSCFKLFGDAYFLCKLHQE